MRWLPFAILAYVVLGLQMGAAHALQWHGTGPSFVLLAVVFIAASAPRDPALLAAIILGFLQDLTTQGTMGLYCFSFGCAALLISSTQSAVNHRHPLSHVVLTFIAGLMVAIILAMHNWIRPPSLPRPPTSPYFYSAIYTAILAPIVLGILMRMRKLFAFTSARGRVMGH